MKTKKVVIATIPNFMDRSWGIFIKSPGSVPADPMQDTPYNETALREEAVFRGMKRTLDFQIRNIPVPGNCLEFAVHPCTRMDILSNREALKYIDFNVSASMPEEFGGVPIVEDWEVDQRLIQLVMVVPE